MKCSFAAPRRGIPIRVRPLSGSLLVTILLLSGVAAAQPSATGAASLTTFLAALEGNPELLAAEAATEAAEFQLRAARDPVALSATGGYSRIEIDESKLSAAQVTDPGTGGDTGSGGFAAGTLPANGFQLSTTLSFRPIPFGDVADLVKQSELALASSRLDLQNSRASLETRALEAALSSRLAERSVALARQGIEAATEGLEATRKRAEKGAANARDLRNAEEALAEAQTLADNARTDAETARLNLKTLVGDTPAPSFADLGRLAVPRSGVPLTVAQAQIQSQQAALGIGAAQRELYPVAQASYNVNLSDSSSLTASLESRTLQPSLGYTFQDPARTSPENAVSSSFQIGISANISLSAIETLKAVERQQAAAAEGLKAQQTGGALQASALGEAYTKAVRDAALQGRKFSGAQLTYQENVTRQALGLSSPIESRTSLIDLLQADLERRSSELTSLSALLDIYELYALPPSETLP